MARGLLRWIAPCLIATTVVLAWPAAAIAAPIVFQATGGMAGDILPTVNVFRSALGDPNNVNAPGPLAGGRREINWDGGGTLVTTIAATPFAGFQNTRGALFTTPGTGFVQATPEGLATEFNPTYGTFPTFSPLRLFSAIGSNITDVTFSIPGDPGTPAFVTGFGVIFSDVDIPGSAQLQFFDQAGNPLSTPFLASVLNNGLSFLGVLFDAGEQVWRVRITSGNVALGPNDSATADVVLMDDFIYGEPRTVAAVPEPGTMMLLAAGLAGAAAVRRRRRAH